MQVLHKENSKKKKENPNFHFIVRCRLGFPLINLIIIYNRKYQKYEVKIFNLSHHITFYYKDFLIHAKKNLKTNEVSQRGLFKCIT